MQHVLTPAEIERRVVRYLDQDERSRKLWRPLGTYGEMWLHRIAVEQVEGQRANRLRAQALEFMGLFNSRRSIDVLLEALEESNLPLEVRAGILRGLGANRSQRGIPILRVHSFHKNPMIQVVALESLHRRADVFWTHDLRFLAHSSNETVAQTARRLLQEHAAT